MTSEQADESGSTTRATEHADADRKTAAARRQRTVMALRGEILRQVEDLAAQPNRSVRLDPAAIERVHGLDRVLRAYERARPAPPSHRRFLIGGFALTAGLMAALLFMRVGSTEITLDLRVESLSFDSARKQLLTGTVGATRVAVGGIDRIVMPPGADGGAVDDPRDDGETLAAALAAPAGGVLSVGPIEVPRGTRVEIGGAEADGTTSIALIQPATDDGAGKPMVVQITVPSGVTLDVANGNAGPQSLDLDRPRPIDFVVAPATEAYLDVTPRAAKPVAFAAELEIGRISFARVVELEDEAARRLSTVLGGTVFLESLGGKAYHLRQGEHLEIVLDTATVSALSVSPDAIGLRASGRARALSVGSPGTAGNAGNSRNLMPRWLEWLTARHEVELFWAATLYAFGLLLGVLRFWGIGR
ncbi:MAG: hypothetical protein ACFCUO_12775 [Rhodospirillales bacterium]